MEKISKNISLYLFHHNLIYENQIEWCQYIITNHMMGFLSFIVLVSLGALVSNFFSSLIFFFFFRFLRSRTGGFHAKTPFGCIVASSLNQIAFLLLSQVNSTKSFLWILCIPTIIIIFSLSPANNANLHLSSHEFLSLKPKIYYRVIITASFAVLMSYIDIQISACITAAMISVALLLSLAHLGFGQQ